MYQYSLVYVKRLFNTAIEKSPQQPALEQRLTVLIDRITELMYLNVSRGLFVTHKVLFSFLMCTSINRNNGIINDQLWSCLLRGAGIMNKTNMPENPSPGLITQNGWDMAYYLQLVMPEKFEEFTDHVSDNITLWEDYCASSDPQLEPLPEPYNESLD